MRHPSRTIVTVLFSILFGCCLPSCNKLVTVPQPVNSITTTEMFNTDAQAATAMSGLYSTMVNGALSYSNGYTTLLCGMSSDELFYYGTGDADVLAFSPNQLISSNTYIPKLWSTAYKTIYNANAIIEGIAASTSGLLHDTARQRMTAEAKFVRAFSYFYLVNLFGDVPLILTIDFNKVQYSARTPAADVYRQVVQDLKDAQSNLGADYSSSGAARERILPNKWTATALLARLYLYQGDYADAAAQADSIIGNTSLFNLEANPNNVFLVGSKEAIWQLKQGTKNIPENATIEGYTTLPNPLATGVTHYCLSTNQMSAFESGDRRRSAWVDSTYDSAVNVGKPRTYTYYAYKYKVGTVNYSNSTPTEYYMMFRLAEMYLVRAEAEANGATGGSAAAIADLNVLRSRAGLAALPATLTTQQVIAAVAHERQVELFAEWGHRWFDLQRTGQAHAVLSVVSWKQPWTGDSQLLYPIPATEIQTDPNLSQNPGY